MTSTGDARSTEVRPLGSELVADAPIGSLALSVDFAADFDEDGGTLVLNDVTLDYVSVDHDAETITLAAALVDPAFADDFVAQVEDGKPGVEVKTQVALDEGDPTPVTVPTGLVGFFAEGESDDSSAVQVQSLDDGGYQVLSRPGTDSLYDGGSIWNPRAKVAMGSTNVRDDTWTSITSWLPVDVDGITVGTNARIVFDGSYMVLTRLSFPSNATGRRGVRITFNGAFIETALQSAEPSGVTYVGVFDSLRAIADDTVGVQVYQSSGSTLTVANGSMTIFRLSS